MKRIFVNLGIVSLALGAVYLVFNFAVAAKTEQDKSAVSTVPCGECIIGEVILAEGALSQPPADPKSKDLVVMHSLKGEDGTVWKLSLGNDKNPAPLLCDAGYVGRKVKVSGKIDKEKKTIEVADFLGTDTVKAAADMPASEASKK